MRKTILLSALLAAAISASAQRTPTMGWSSWNTFALNINEQVIRQQADVMHTSGLQEAGYRYVNIDDGYWDGRAADGHLRLNTKLFPSGMRSLVDYIHSLGLKAGIYSDAGDNTCGSGNRHAWGIGVGFAGHEKEDCQLYFRDWDFDFIKVDYCGGSHMKLDEQEQYTKISNAIKNCGKKDIVFNICRWAYPGNWVSDISDSWRTTGDIYDAWKSVKGILAENLYLSAYCHDGHYNDMDMLEVGRSMSQTEDETHFGMWCIMASPLLIGCDMSTLKDKSQTLALLTNTDLISLNQDKLHLQAYVADKQGECFVMVKDIKELYGKERAVAVYNPSDEEQSVVITPQLIDLDGAVEYYDCIRQQPFLYDKNPVTVTVAPHGTKIFKVKGTKRIERTRYEAETAWLPAYQELRNPQSERTAVYTASEYASGGYFTGFLGMSPKNELQWKNVHVEKAGTRTLTITCFSGQVRKMNLSVNGKQVTTLTTQALDWDQPQTLTATVTLKKGDNIVSLSNPDEWMPDIDVMTIQ